MAEPNAPQPPFINDISMMKIKLPTLSQQSIAIISLFLLILLIYSSYCNTFYSPPVLDDYHSFVEEKKIHVDELSVQNLISLSQTNFGWERWVPLITFAIDYRLGEGEIIYFHITNLLIHILCALSIFLLILQLLEIKSKSAELNPKILPYSYAVWISAFWALNPVQTNAVTYLVQRMASIQTLFYVLTILFYVVGRRNQTELGFGLRSRAYFIASFLSALGAIFSKENSAMLPVMLIATETWFFSPDLLLSVTNKLRKNKRKLCAIIVIGFPVALYLGFCVFEKVTAGYATRSFSLSERLLTEARVVIWYMGLLLMPIPSRLSIEHDVAVSTSLFNPPTTIVAIVLLSILLFATFRYRRRFPLITYGGIWFFLNLIIESTVVPLELVFEHRLYLPSIGFFLFIVVACVWILGRLLGKLNSSEFLKVSWSAFFIIASVLTLLTFQRNEAWQSFVSFNQDAVEKAPGNPRAHANLAVAYGRSGKYDEAIKEAEIAISVGKPYREKYMVAASAIVSCLVGLGKPKEAAERAEELLKDRPEDFDGKSLPNFYLQLAEAYRQAGQLEKAYQSALSGLKVAQHAGASFYDKKLISGMLVRLFKQAGEEAIDLDSTDDKDLHGEQLKIRLAKLFFKFGEADYAKVLLQDADAINSNQKTANELLLEIQQNAELNREQGEKWSFSDKYIHHPFSPFRFCMAVAYAVRERRLPLTFLRIGEYFLKEALRLQPKNPDAHLLMAWYHLEKKEPEQAISSARRALEFDPKYAKGWLGLGFFLMAAGRNQEALHSFQNVLALYPGCPQRSTIEEILQGINKKSKTLAVSRHDGANGYRFKLDIGE